MTTDGSEKTNNSGGSDQQGKTNKNGDPVNNGKLSDVLKNRKMVIASIAATLFLLSGIVASAAGNSKPGSGLFPVRSAIENSGFILKSSAIDKANYHLDLAQNRLDDLEDMKDPSDPDAINKVAEEFSFHITEAQALAADLSEEDRMQVEDAASDLMVKFSVALANSSGSGDDSEDITSPTLIETSTTSPEGSEENSTSTSLNNATSTTVDDDDDSDDDRSSGTDDDDDSSDDRTTSTSEDDDEDDDEDEDDHTSTTQGNTTSTTDDDDNDDDSDDDDDDDEDEDDDDDESDDDGDDD